MTRKSYLILLILLAETIVAAAQIPHVRSRNYTTREGLVSNVVNTIIQDRQGYLWLGTNHGLTRFDGHRFANFYIEEDGERCIQGITHIAEDTVENVLLMSGNDYRLLCFDLKKLHFIDTEGRKYPSTEDAEAKETAYIARANAIGIQRGNITHRRHDLHYVQLPDGRELFTTIDNGFYIYDPAKQPNPLFHFSSKDDNPVIESDYINDVCLDRSGSVWLATTFAGIYQLDLDQGQLLYHPLSGGSANIRSFSELPDGTIAVGDMDGSVFRYDPQTRQSEFFFHQGPRAYAMRTDPQGRFWIGTRGGGVWIESQRSRIVERRRKKVKGHELLSEGEKCSMVNVQWSMLDLPARQIFDICFEPDGSAWIGTFDAGLLKMRADRLEIKGQFLPDEKIHQMLIDRRGRLWVATESGIFRREGGEFRQIFNKGKVVCVTQGPADTIYAGSNGYGLLTIVDDRVGYFTTSEGLANNCVEAIAVDSEGRVIAATDQGVSVINHHNGTVQNIYSPLGLLADTYNEDAILRTSGGRIFLGSQRGLAELKPHPQPLPSGRGDAARMLPPCLTSIDINDVPYYDNLSGELRLPHNQNNLCFNFSSFAYKDLSSVIYSYWLEGIDRNWRPATRESHALYNELRPGRYRFHLRYRLSGGDWSQECVLDVRIAQPWWWTWWAKLLYLLAIAIFVWYEWHQYKQRLSLRRQLDQRLAVLYAKEKGEEEKTSEGSGLPKSQATDPSPFLNKLDQLIQSDLMKSDLDVNYLAGQMCMSYSTLHRRIKSLTGLSANEYVRKHRLTKAMQLLRGGTPASEVAMQCGFNSPSYFTRCFKAEYGILPSEVG